MLRIDHLNDSKQAKIHYFCKKTSYNDCSLPNYVYLCEVKESQKDMKSRAEIISLLRRYKPTAQKKYGITKLGIFGSVARGEQTPDSDIDVYYEGLAPSFLTLDMIQSELEQLLDSKVDLVRVRDNMNSLLRQRILRDGIYV